MHDEDIKKDLSEIKQEVIALRIEIEKGKSSGRVAWMMSTFFVGILGWFVHTGYNQYTENENKRDSAILLIQQQYAVLQDRTTKLELKDERTN